MTETYVAFYMPHFVARTRYLWQKSRLLNGILKQHSSTPTQTRKRYSVSLLAGDTCDKVLISRQVESPGCVI